MGSVLTERGINALLGSINDPMVDLRHIVTPENTERLIKRFKAMENGPDFDNLLILAEYALEESKHELVMLAQDFLYQSGVERLLRNPNVKIWTRTTEQALLEYVYTKMTDIKYHLLAEHFVHLRDVAGHPFPNWHRSEPKNMGPEWKTRSPVKELNLYRIQNTETGEFYQSSNPPRFSKYGRFFHGIELKWILGKSNIKKHYKNCVVVIYHSDEQIITGTELPEIDYEDGIMNRTTSVLEWLDKS